MAKKILWDESASASSNARARLPAMLQSYFDQGRKLVGRPSASIAPMHPFRLETKALRYTLELFRPCFGPGLEGFLLGLRRIQDCLGALNDYATTKALLGARLPKRAPEWEMANRVLTARAKRKSLEFRHYWRQTFDKPGEDRRWMSYVSRPHKAIRS